MSWKFDESKFYESGQERRKAKAEAKKEEKEEEKKAWESVFGVLELQRERTAAGKEDYHPEYHTPNKLIYNLDRRKYVVFLNFTSDDGIIDSWIEIKFKSKGKRRFLQSRSATEIWEEFKLDYGNIDEEAFEVNSKGFHRKYTWRQVFEKLG